MLALFTHFKLMYFFKLAFLLRCFRWRQPAKRKVFKAKVTGEPLKAGSWKSRIYGREWEYPWRSLAKLNGIQFNLCRVDKKTVILGKPRIAKFRQKNLVFERYLYYNVNLNNKKKSQKTGIFFHFQLVN